MLLALSAAALLGQMLLALAVWWNHRQTPEVSGEPPLSIALAPALVVVVPARNEEHNIGECVAALCASDYPHLRVRVVDDGSSDRTSEVARASATGNVPVEVVAAGELPPGWLGKNNAAAVGARDGDEPWVLFLDADLRVAPTCIARAMAMAVRREADLFTMMPRLEMRTFWEVVVQPVIAQLIDAWMPASEINDPRRRRSGAIGPFMLFRRSAYLAIGGHASVRGEVVEDLRLAERVKANGKRLLYARGVELATVRMYDSLRAIVRGWTKNFHVAMRGALWAAPLAAAGVLFLYAGPLVLPLIALATRRHGLAFSVGAAAWLTAAIARIDLARCFGVTARHLALAPLGAAVVAWIILASSLRAATGGSVEWKGRAVR